MKSELFVYLSGPITARHGYSVEENVAHAVKYYFRLLANGIPCFCPQASALFPAAWSDVTYEAWMDYDFSIINRCTHVMMLPRWETSAGAVRERDYAIERGIPVVHTDHVF